MSILDAEKECAEHKAGRQCQRSLERERLCELIKERNMLQRCNAYWFLGHEQ